MLRNRVTLTQLALATALVSAQSVGGAVEVLPSPHYDPPPKPSPPRDPETRAKRKRDLALARQRRKAGISGAKLARKAARGKL